MCNGKRPKTLSSNSSYNIVVARLGDGQIGDLWSRSRGSGRVAQSIKVTGTQLQSSNQRAGHPCWAREHANHDREQNAAPGGAPEAFERKIIAGLPHGGPPHPLPPPTPPLKLCPSASTRSLRLGAPINEGRRPNLDQQPPSWSELSVATDNGKKIKEPVLAGWKGL